MTEIPSKTVIRAWARLMKAQQLTLGSIERSLKAAGLPPLGWYDVLLEVERTGETGLRPFELEKAVLLAQYNLSRIVDRIERAGYVERRACDDDGRGQRIVITKAGLAIRRKMWPIYSQAIEAAIGQHVSRNDAEVLDELLGRLIERNTGG
jgi:DNA-binding MarR family transcriptional regulator